MSSTDATTDAFDPNASDKLDPAVIKLGLVTMLGAIMTILDTTIVNIALDSLHRDLHSTLANIQWVVTGYMLALAAVIPLSGWTARRFGAKQIWLFSLVMFTLGSALCGFATSTTELVIFRVIQGVGGGMLMPVGQMMMAQAAGPKRMGRVMSIIGVPMMLAPIFGPTIGGIILQDLSWRWIFYVNIPIGILGLVLGILRLPESHRQPTDSLDWVGLALMCPGLPLIIYGLAEIATVGSFNSAKVLVPIAIGLVLVALFVAHAFRAKNPLLKMHLYERPTFSAASVSSFMLAATMFGGMILLPLYWQTVRHESIIDTGLLLIPQGLGTALMLPFVGKMTDRYGGGPFALAGVILTAILTLPFAFLKADTSVVWIEFVLLVRGLGMGLAMMPAMTAAFASLHHDEVSHATPQLNVVQRVGGSFGVAILAVVLQRALSSAQAQAHLHTAAHNLNAVADGYGKAFAYSVGMVVIAIPACVWLFVAERKARREHIPTEHEAIESGAVAEAAV